MKVSAVISPKLIKKESIRYDKISFVNFLVLASGLFAGVLIFVLSEDYLTGEIWDYFISFSVDFSSKTGIEILSGILMSHLPYILLIIVFGTSTCGILPIYLLSFVKTIGLSLVNSYIYSTYSLKGIEYSIMVFFPGKFVLLFSIMLLMHICINSAKNIRRISIGEGEYPYSFTEYLIKVSVAVLLFVLSSVIDCLAVICFSSLFSFG